MRLSMNQVSYASTTALFLTTRFVPAPQVTLAMALPAESDDVWRNRFSEDSQVRDPRILFRVCILCGSATVRCSAFLFCFGFRQFIVDLAESKESSL